MSASRGRVGLLLGLWILVGAVVWIGIYDLYISRGAREYLQLSAEAELGRGTVPSMAGVMRRSKDMGATAGTYWALFVTGAGWVTVWMMRRTRT